MALSWFRMYAEWASDPVVQSLAFEDQRHHAVILCLKCNGTLDRDISPDHRERIIIRGLGLDTVTASEAKRRLMEVGLIDAEWHPKGWDKRQFTSDISTDRVRNYRKNKKAGNVSGTLQETTGNSSGNGPEQIQNRTDTETTFALFWTAYPKKLDKESAFKAWRKIKPDQQLFDTIMQALERFKALEDWKKEKGKFIPYGATWLNKKRWQDEISPPQGGGNGHYRRAV
jgi:hypothetical protein